MSNEWIDISMEEYREYVYLDGTVFKIDKPTKLMVNPKLSSNSPHRVQTEDRFGYYVAPGWIAVRWQAKPGGPIFVT